MAAALHPTSAASDVDADLENHTHTPPLPANPSFFRLLRFYARAPAFWAIVVSHIAQNYGWYVFLMWTPQFFSDLGVNLSDIGLFAVFPYLAMFFSDIAWAQHADNKVARGQWTRTYMRKCTQKIAFITPCVVIAILLATGMRSPMLCSLLLTIGLGVNVISHSGYWANLIDLAPNYAGFACGLANSFGTLPGIYGNTMTGFVLRETCSWTAVFGVAMAHWVIGLGVYLRHASSTQLSMDPTELD